MKLVDPTPCDRVLRITIIANLCPNMIQLDALDISDVALKKWCFFRRSVYIYVYSHNIVLVTSRIFFLVFRKCSESSENTIRSSCNYCFEWHIVMQYCPVANYHYAHNLWQSVRGDSIKKKFVCLFSENGSISEQIINGAFNSSYNSIKFCINKAKKKKKKSPCTQTIHWL